MKKIKSLHQLQSEKKRIKQHQEELENKMKLNWGELKESLKPVNVAKDAVNTVMRNKAAVNLNNDSILKSSFAYGVTLLAIRLADKAGRKFGSFFKK